MKDQMLVQWVSVNVLGNFGSLTIARKQSRSNFAMKFHSINPLGIAMELLRMNWWRRKSVALKKIKLCMLISLDILGIVER